MSERTTPYPLPDAALRGLPPDRLARIAVEILRRVYGVELTGDAAGLRRLQALLRERFRLGQYSPDSYPGNLAMAIGAFVGEALLRMLPDGQWGVSDDNLYGTPLPFLLYLRGEYARQINVVEDAMMLFWTGRGDLPADYIEHFTAVLRRLGFDSAA